MEKENQAKTLQDMLSKQEASIQRLKQEHDRVLVEKNLDINRLETGKMSCIRHGIHRSNWSFWVPRTEIHPERSCQLQEAQHAEHQN